MRAIRGGEGGGRDGEEGRKRVELNYLPVDANSLSLVEIWLSVDGGDALGVT